MHWSLFLAITCLSKHTGLHDLRSWQTDRFSEQIISRNNISVRIFRAEESLQLEYTKCESSVFRVFWFATQTPDCSI